MHAPRRRTATTLAVLALTLSALTAAFVVRRSLACPVVVEPQTLRLLYKHSDRIVVARVGHTELVKRDESASSVRTALHVARNVKGKDDGPLVFVHHTTWEEEGVELPGTYEQGERVLVFLERMEEGEGYVVNDATYGVKKLSDDDLELYLARIGELDAIEGRNPPDTKALAEWLVRCAEEPATRWEGAYELSLSTAALARADEQKEQPADAEADTADTGEQEAESAESETDAASADAPADPAARPVDALPVPQGIQVEPAERRRAVIPDASLVAALGEDQKRRLADALFAAEKMGDGENVLLNVVMPFGDPRFVPFLVAQLRRVEDDPPPQAEWWLEVLSQVMKNEEAAELVTKYAENVTYYEEEETAGETAVDEETASADEQAVDEAAAQKEMEAREAAANERARRKRSAMLKDLLARVEGILAAPDVARR